ncbi:hypothetical protein [Clostridium sp. UBA2485]|nr:hypothetical protein [Clostridium sp. UBA2485]
MGKVIIVEPNITREESEENLKQIIAVLESIAQEIFIEKHKIREA